MPENDYDDEYELGKDVTPLATEGKKKDTAVVSVRMTDSEIANLERIGRESGKTVSQVIREAVAAYRAHRPLMVIDANGVTIATGQPLN